MRRTLIQEAFRNLKYSQRYTGYGSRLYWSGMLRYLVEAYPSGEAIEKYGLVRAWELLLADHEDYREVTKDGDEATARRTG